LFSNIYIHIPTYILTMTCPECKTNDTIKIGKRITRHGTVQKIQCKTCGRTFQDQYQKADKQ
jgi:transposase-like protein